ncbi:cytochrome P450 monooxygenase-like protein [Plenodomus tracheiphilus IPT5]|uniref:Cytochrome P450 monooxygenase-like protein n=1 Tax=Plenodomus tracheiphilus IPT5 TaxID=1408161 RepID=A0A6A7BGN6_9PLEO|nr:cytochrome P450 monooxygenase-like protein [Plenodomus tracheiphilus IPT5]
MEIFWAGTMGMPLNVIYTSFTALSLLFLYRIFYMQKLHPLSSFPGPWYAISFSIVGAIISIQKREHMWFMYLVRKYGTDRPIRISPTTLLFPRPSALKDIYREPQLDEKSEIYGTGALGAPHLFTALGSDKHRALRKALSNAPWSIGQLRKAWEPQFNDQVSFFVTKMHEHAAAKRTICLSDKVAEFAADILSMISFTEPFGCVRNQRDEKGIMANWRKGLPFFGLAVRWHFFRVYILNIPVLGSWLLPATTKESGMGWLMCEADRQLTRREKQIAEKSFDGKPDFMQHCIEARFSDGSPLTHMQRSGHCTLLIQAGVDTTATAMASILQLLLVHPSALAKVRAEIETADAAGLLSAPVLYDETRQHLPFLIGAIKEGLRLQPPAPQILSRVVPQGGKTIDGHFVPGGFDVTSHAYTVQRDKSFYGEDVEEFEPERWIVGEKRLFELEAAQLTFGTGARGCIGKEVAMLEMYKVLPEIIRRFNIELVRPGKYTLIGGVAYNDGLLVKLSARISE